MGRWSMAIGPLVLKQNDERIVKLLRKRPDHLAADTRGGRRWWGNQIHYPTDSTLLGNRVRVLMPL